MDYQEKFDNWKKQGIVKPLIQLYWRSNCNFRCSFCSVANKKSTQKRLSASELKKHLSDFDNMGIAQIVITGGEPLTFPDLSDLLSIIDTTRFYTTIDSNGWLLTSQKARWLKSQGVQKIQLSLDNFDKSAHDKLRGKKGSWDRCIAAIGYCKDIGLKIIVSTYATRQRIWSNEFIQFLELMKLKDVTTYCSFAKPLGSNCDMTDFITEKDEQHIKDLQSHYKVFSHLDSPLFKPLDGCCPALKRIVSMDCYGNVSACPGLQTMIGNIRNNKLDEIINNAKVKLLKNGCIAARDVV